VALSENGIRIGLQQLGAVIWPEKPPGYTRHLLRRARLQEVALYNTILFCSFC